MTPYIIKAKGEKYVTMGKIIIQNLISFQRNEILRIKKVLEYYGYQMSTPKGGSSHYTFRKKGHFPITIPKHEPIKKAYVEMVKQVIEREVTNDEKSE